MGQPESPKLDNIVFTPREWDVLACIAVGHTVSKEIARSLGTSHKTIENHISHILIKIQRRKRHHIVSFIQEAGLEQQLRNTYHRQFLPREVPSHTTDFFIHPLQTLKKRTTTKWMLIGAWVVLGGLMSWWGISHFISSYSAPIQASLINPPHASLLPRDNLMHQLEKALSSRKDMAIVGLVGTGGVGKTTLARAYARAHSSPLTWEINAERAETLLSSFNNLAYHLARSPEQKAVLSEINTLQDTSTRTQRLLQFVQEILQKQSSWLLIFDNVDDLPLCRSFLPTRTWGEGKVILTTRNQNIKQLPLISSVLDVSELNEEEAFILFVNLFTREDSSHLSMEKRQSIQAFLAQIPRYPLDISLAAHYMRDANLSFDHYLECLASHNTSFHQHEKNIWQEVSDYSETRYAIVTLSIERLLDHNPHYLGLFWMLAFMDSQHIPMQLLRCSEDPTFVDPFIHDLKKFSFITSEPNDQTFSMHRITQTILRHYLKKKGEGKEQSHQEATAQALIQCAKQTIEQDNYPMIHQLTSHLEQFTHNAGQQEGIRSMLGILYYYTAQYNQAELFLEKSIKVEREKKKIDYEMLVSLFFYLGNTYKEMMKSTKSKQAFDQGIALCQNYFASDPAKSMRLTTSLANIYRRFGDFEKTEDLCIRNLALYEKYAPTDYKGITETLNTLCVAHREQGHYPKAESYINQSLEIYRKYLPNNPVEYAHALGLLGHVRSDQGLYETARSLLEESLRINLQHLPPENPKVLWLYVKLGTLHRRFGDVKKALSYLDQVKNEKNPSFYTTPMVLALTHHERAHIALQQNKIKEAIAFAEKSHAIFSQYYGPAHTKTMRALNLLGYMAIFDGNHELAEEYLQKALETFTQHQLPLRCQALDYLSELKALKASRTEVEALRQRAVFYSQQAIDLAKVYFPVDSVHLSHLQKQKDRCMKAVVSEADSSLVYPEGNKRWQ
jgi:DNA-binding CsgD family transcriptional regulator